MSQRDLAALGLDERRVRVVAATAHGYGMNLKRRSQHASERLSCARLLLLAGGCWSLLERQHARQSYREAAGVLGLISARHAVLASICAGETPKRARQPWTGSPWDVALSSLRLCAWTLAAGRGAAGVGQDLNELRDAATRFGPHPTGHFGVRLNDYLDFAADIVSRRRPGLPGSTGRVLMAAAASVAVAQTDTFHWRRIESGLMPVEPEWLVLGVLAHRAATGRWTTTDLKDAGITSELAAVPLRIARRMEPPEELSVAPEPSFR